MTPWMTFVMILGGAIISLKIFGSVVKGRPLSSISSNNYTKLDIIIRKVIYNKGQTIVWSLKWHEGSICYVKEIYLYINELKQIINIIHNTSTPHHHTPLTRQTKYLVDCGKIFLQRSLSYRCEILSEDVV